MLVSVPRAAQWSRKKPVISATTRGPSCPPPGMTDVCIERTSPQRKLHSSHRVGRGICANTGAKKPKKKQLPVSEATNYHLKLDGCVWGFLERGCGSLRLLGGCASNFENDGRHCAHTAHCTQLLRVLCMFHTMGTGHMPLLVC